jgi:DNA-binding NarL/FixJ family response regulator
MTKQETIERLKRENEQLLEQIKKLSETADSQFTASHTYAAMKKENDFLRNMAHASESTAAYWQGQIAQSRAENAQLRIDNTELLKRIDSDAQYKVGLPGNSEIENLEKEILSLQTRIAERDATIAFLRKVMSDYIYEESEEKPNVDDPSENITPSKRGRPSKITEVEKREIRNYRRQGYSVREISDISGFSVGTVQKIVQHVKVDPEKVKERKKRKN